MSDWLDAEAHAERAFEMFERGRWAEAEIELRKALSLNPSHAEWQFNLGLTLEAAGRDAEALNCYERAIELLPTEVEPLVASGIVANRLQQYEQAIARFDEALRMDRRCEPAYAHKMQSHLRLGGHDEVETTYYLAQHALDDPSPHCLAVMAESLIERNEHRRAGWCLREALRLEPSMPRLRARLGAVFAATGKPHRALQMYLRDLRDDPGNIDTLLDYGELLIDLGRLPEAAEKFRRVLEIEPANIDAHVLLGQIAMRSRQYEQAYVEFELVARLDPDYLQVRFDLAEVLLRRRRGEDARQTLLEGLAQLKRRDGDAETRAVDLDRLGRLLLEAGLFREAEAVTRRAIEQTGSTAQRWRRIALARFQAGDREQGSAASRKVLRMDPNCLRSIHNLALAALEEGRVVVASGWIRRGLRIDRHDEGLRRLRTRAWLAGLRRLLGFRRPLTIAARDVK